MADDRDRGYGQRGPGGYGGYTSGGTDRPAREDDRSFVERAADEVRSWFGDEDADRRRHMDARRDPEGAYHYHSPEQTGSGFGNQYGGQMGQRADYGQADYSRGPGYGAYARPPSQAYPHPYDEHYRTWRDRQIEQFDRDYEEFRRQRQDQFQRDFDDWRHSRATQAGAVATGAQYATKIREHQDVLGADGEYVGTVDRVEGDQIKLTRQDGRHHFLPLSMVVSVDNAVRLDCSAAEARRQWRVE